MKKAEKFTAEANKENCSVEMQRDLYRERCG